MHGLIGPFTKIARAMSKRWNVSVVMTGAECSTDGKTIKLPFTADYLSSEKRLLLNGMLDHEMCHVIEEQRHENAGRKTPMSIVGEQSDKRMKLLFNVFEDIRIEQRYEDIYPGMAENIRSLNIDCAKTWAKNHRSAEAKDFWRTFSVAIITRARNVEGDWTYEGKIGECMSLIEEEIAESKMKGVWSDASLELAKRVFEKLKDEEEQKEDEQKDDKKEEGEGEKDEEEDKEGKGKGSGDKEGGSGFESEPEHSDPIDGLREQMKDDVIRDARENSRYIPHPNALKLDRVGNPNLRTGAVGTYDRAKAEVLSEIGAMRRKQRMLLMSHARRRVRSDIDSGSLDGDMLSEVRLGNTKVFTELTNKRSLNTAIECLIDCSGSMGNNLNKSHAAYYAFRTAIGLAETWSSIGVPNEFLGFTADDLKGIGATKNGKDDPYFYRSPLIHIVIKPFDRTIRDCRAEFASAIQGQRGSNVDGEAVLWAAGRLQKRPEKRKILVVVSDGIPMAGNGAGAGHPDFNLADTTAMHSHLREAVSSVSRSGIEVIGIGAGVDAPKIFYNKDTGAKFVAIKDVSTMAVDTFSVMRSQLEKRIGHEK